MSQYLKKSQISSGVLVNKYPKPPGYIVSRWLRYSSSRPSKITWWIFHF